MDFFCLNCYLVYVNVMQFRPQYAMYPFPSTRDRPNGELEATRLKDKIMQGRDKSKAIAKCKDRIIHLKIHG